MPGGPPHGTVRGRGRRCCCGGGTCDNCVGASKNELLATFAGIANGTNCANCDNLNASYICARNDGLTVFSDPCNDDALTPYVGQPACAWWYTGDFAPDIGCGSGTAVSVAIFLVEGTNGKWAVIVYYHINAFYFYNTFHMWWLKEYDTIPDCSVLTSLVLTDGFVTDQYGGCPPPYTQCDPTSATATLS